jgi:SH3-like domain-containing protein
MRKHRKVLQTLAGCVLSLVLTLAMHTNVLAADNQFFPGSGGVGTLMDPRSSGSQEVLKPATHKEMETPSDLVMANVKNTLNIRQEPNEAAEKVGKLYKDCGGTILERKDGWTKLQSGNLIGWANDKYLLFGEDAKELANSVGKMIATINTEALNVRMEPNLDAGIYGVFPKGEITEVVEVRDDDFTCVDFDGNNGYVSSQFVSLDFQIDAGETLEEIKVREAAEQEAKRHVNYGEYTTDADTVLLLAALIQCEAGGESYEGKVAVGAVVMNRVRSGAYPNSIHGVIYASGQFTPALSGKVNRVYESGKISDSCIQAATDAIGGTSNVGDLTHFRRNNGRAGLVIGNHVFY